MIEIYTIPFMMEAEWTSSPLAILTSRLISTATTGGLVLVIALINLAAYIIVTTSIPTPTSDITSSNEVVKASPVIAISSTSTSSILATPLAPLPPTGLDHL